MNEARDNSDGFIPFPEALSKILDNVPVLSAISLPAGECDGHVAAEDVQAHVSSPPADVSLMDGFAVCSRETATAGKQSPVKLRMAAESAAGQLKCAIEAGECARIFTGALIPDGADAVIAGEDCEERGGVIVIENAIPPGLHVRSTGEDFREGENVLEKGELINPGRAALLVSAGIGEGSVVRKPGVAILAVGDELAEPGAEPGEGKIYSSNTTVISAWLSRFGMSDSSGLAGDDSAQIAGAVGDALKSADAVVTTGGAWGSGRDLVQGVLDGLGWTRLFSRVGIRPGKGTGFGLLDGKPVFVLPGGPTSCEIAFLELALPGLLRMAGREGTPFFIAEAVLTEAVRQTHGDWHRFLYGVHQYQESGTCIVAPMFSRSRLQAMARATCMIPVPAGSKSLVSGQEVSIQILLPAAGRMKA